jgi:mRNA-degrading endonuclease YafQ of YafQ-DinJ toxin-antitoxin module
MEVSFGESFKKAFRKRSKDPVLEKEFWRLELFVNNFFEPKLKTHKLFGKLKGLGSFYIDYDFRVGFYFTKKKPKKAVFVDICTHDEVY